MKVALKYFTVGTGAPFAMMAGLYKMLVLYAVS